MQSETGLSGHDISSVLLRLIPRIEIAGKELYGDSVVKAAWNDFNRWGLEAISREEQAYTDAFRAWYVFAWLPDDTSLNSERFSAPVSDHPIAMDFLEAQRSDLSPVEQGVIKVARSAPYSFYTVRTVGDDQRLHLQEIYTERDLVVEAAETGTYAEGDLLFSAVISVNGVSVLLGCMPNVLSDNDKSTIEQHSEKWKAEEGGKIDRRLLYLHDTELRRFYFMLLSKAQRAGLH